MFESDEPFVGDAEGLRALVGVVEPIALIGGPVLREPNGGTDRWIAGELDGEIIERPLYADGEDDDHDDHDSESDFLFHVFNHHWKCQLAR